MVLSVTTSFYQGGAFPRQRNRWHSSLRNIEQENNFQGETIELIFDFLCKTQIVTGKRELPVHVRTSNNGPDIHFNLKIL